INFHEAPGGVGEHVDSPYAPNNETLVRIATVEIPGGRRFFDTQVTFSGGPLLIEAVADLGIQARRQLPPVNRAHGNEHCTEKQRIARSHAETQGPRNPAKLFEARHATPAVRPPARPASRQRACPALRSCSRCRARSGSALTGSGRRSCCAGGGCRRRQCW